VGSGGDVYCVPTALGDFLVVRWRLRVPRK